MFLVRRGGRNGVRRRTGRQIVRRRKPGSTRQSLEREQQKHGVSLRDLLRRKNQLKTHNDNDEKDQGNQPPGICGEQGEILEAAHQVSPGWHRLHHAQAQDAQVRFGQNEQRDGNKELRIEKRAQVWRDVAQQEARRFAAGRTSQEQEIGISDAARRSADDANRSLPAQEAHHQESDDDRDERRNIQRQQGSHDKKKK